MRAKMDKDSEITGAELLDRYWKEVVEDPAATPPEGLPPELAGLAAALAANAMAPAQDEASTGRVRRRLETAMSAAAQERAHHRRAAGRGAWPWSWAGALFGSPLGRLATAAVLVMAAVGAYLFALRPAPVSAQEILGRAQAAAASPLAGGVKSFSMSSIGRTVDPTGRQPELRSEEQRWYAGPELWRVETRQDAVAPDGTRSPRAQAVQVSDGVDVWQYDVLARVATVQRASPALGGQGSVSGFGQGPTDLGGLLSEATRCFNPRLAGSAVVAGRDAYVVDLGATTCPAAALPGYNGRQVIWVDKATSFILKWNLYGEAGQGVIEDNEVTAVQYDVAIDPGLLRFTPPAGASIRDLRAAPLATPAPTMGTGSAVTPAAAGAPAATPAGASRPAGGSNATVDALLAALAPLAQAADYPLFAPARLPEGLAPRQPRLDPGENMSPTGGRAPATLRIEFVPPEAVTTDAGPMGRGVQVLEQRASYEELAQWTEGATPVAVPTGRAWVRRGVANADGTGTASTVLALRDGTLISATSFDVTPEALFELVSTLQRVPGGHAPLADPVPPTLAEIRKASARPVFVPTWVPDGLKPEPPVGTDTTRIVYHDGSGRAVLTVINAAPGSGPADPRATGQAAPLANGQTAHLLGGGDNALLWWEQDGVDVSLEAAGLARETMLRIADSMSATAELRGVELPAALAAAPAAAVPTATPMPTPAFAVLRPAWLPEEMTVREQVDAEGVLLGFAPKAAAPGQQPVTLRETPLKPGEQVEPVQDPGATVEEIAGQQITVIRRGDACTMFQWTAGGLRLVLTNAYDPGGQVRYSCGQMRQLIASVR